jgi:hypothetical protein
MSEKQSKKAQLQIPEVRFYMAEDVRQEIDGKVSTIGLFPDNVVVLPLPISVPEPTETAPIFFKSLAFVFNISKLSEEADISVDIEISGVRKPLLEQKRHPDPGPGRSINMVVIVQPCTIQSFGLRRVIVTVGEEVQTFEFEIRRGVPEGVETPVEPKIAMSRVKKTRLQTSKDLPKKFT